MNYNLYMDPVVEAARRVRASQGARGTAQGGLRSLGNGKIFFCNGQGKVFLGIATDKVKLVAFSDKARRQLARYYSPGSSMLQVSGTHEVLIDEVDPASGRIVLEYINTNDINAPKPLVFDSLGPNPSFLDDCKLHHACNAFGLNRIYRTDQIRNRIWAHLRNLSKITLEDFQAVFDYLYFDEGLTKEMKRKAAFHTLRGWVADADLEALFTFANDYDKIWNTHLCQEMVACEAEARDVFEKEKEASATLVHKSVAPEALVLPRAPANKASVTSAKDGKGEKAPKAVTPQKPSSNSNPPVTAKKAYGRVGGIVGNVKPAPGLAQLNKELCEDVAEGDGEKGKGKKAVGTGKAFEVARQGPGKGSYANALRS